MRLLVGAVLLACSAAANAGELKPWKGGATPALELADLDGGIHRLAAILT